MRNPYQRKAASVTSEHTTLQPKELYKQFIESIVAQRQLMALYDDGWALCGTPNGQQAFAIWQNKGLAQLMIKGAWESYQTREIPLLSFVQEIIPYLREKNTLLSLNLTPEGQNILVRPEAMLLDIKNYLYQLYVQQPQLFEDIKLPKPRTIRLN
ncbi:DUF2750 domain-containing protein [Acinetobacter soli]|uniref:DUF2750 domain-containing protein n=1 Tax=Acinetobacter soli TaxID=487316 RepID=UPI00125F1724|nr:DUF2750 domain-containing protein [Acinetobacter soli]